MSAAFTPGPWVVSPQGKSVTAPYVIDTPQGQRTASQPIAKIAEARFAEANARLIAAAPELYEALDALLEAAERHIFGDECLSQRNAARAVLRQARGEQ